MGRWIVKGNWENGYGAVIIGFKYYMHGYYLRITDQAARTAQLYTSVALVRILDNSLRVYIYQGGPKDRQVDPFYSSSVRQEDAEH